MAIEPTAQDQYMLELLNRARLNPQAEADRYPLLVGNLNEGLPIGTIPTTIKQPLAFNLKLFQAAQGHSQWMLANNTFSHTGLNGSQVGTRATSAGYSCSTVGENIAWRGTTGNIDLTTTVGQQHEDLFVDTGIIGRGHRINMMYAGFREIGISSVLGNFTSNGTTFNSAITTQNFGKDFGANAFLTGVAYTDKITNDDFYTVGEGLGNITVNAVGNGQTFTTTSLTSGGYSLRLAAGTYNVTFSGDFNNDGVVDTSTARTVTIGADNIKQDFTSDTQSTEGNDVLFGNTNADTIDGQGGNDIISGLGDDDILRGQEGDDSLYGGEGNDTLFGGTGNNYLNGGNGNDVLDSFGGGIDTLVGGAGNDTYGIHNSADIITENTNEGTDTVWSAVNYTLALNVENMYLVGAVNGTGNASNNIISGYGAGDNTINGGGGDDSLYGGEGNDTLFGGAGNNYLNGGNGNDVLDSFGGGIDTLVGGAGNDTYGIHNSADIITENVNEGTDTVWSAVNYTLALNVENMYLVGSVNGTGNASNNIISGYGAGDSIINGGGGDDTLSGGSGNDFFAFGNPLLTLLTSIGVDNITDFNVGNDKIQLSKSAFIAVSVVGNSLAATDFSIVATDATAAIATSLIVYNSVNGHLFYNSDRAISDPATAGFGSNGGQFAQLSSGLGLTNGDFLTIA